MASSYTYARYSEEDALQAELKKHEVLAFQRNRVLHFAEAKIAELEPIGSFCPKVRYWIYLAQELLIEGEPEDWSADDVFQMIRTDKRTKKLKAARRVLEDWRKKKEGKPLDPKWRGRKEGDEQTFG